MEPEPKDMQRLREAQSAESRARKELAYWHKSAARFRRDRALLVGWRILLTVGLIGLVVASAYLIVTYWPWPIPLVMLLFPTIGRGLEELSDPRKPGTRFDSRYRAEMLVRANDRHEDALIELLHAERGMPLQLMCPLAGFSDWEQALDGWKAS